MIKKGQVFDDPVLLDSMVSTVCQNSLRVKSTFLLDNSFYSVQCPIMNNRLLNPESWSFSTGAIYGSVHQYSTMKLSPMVETCRRLGRGSRCDVTCTCNLRYAQKHVNTEFPHLPYLDCYYSYCSLYLELIFTTLTVLIRL